MRLAVLLAAAAILAPASALAQSIAIKGSTGQIVTVTAAEVAKLPRVSFLFDAHGQKHTYEGPLLLDVLAKAGAPTGKDLHGPALANAVVVRASDGYAVVYGLAELDPGTRANRVILADKADGAALDAKDGPFKVVAEGDLRPARSARLVTSIEIVNLGSGRGTPHSHD
ncbi:MAG: molybdopterin-binding oxidoreductase [Alphaproteobacteria bacterium]|nr:molybdopterin-binding oxidoreductase [Alphaproteobacteria bacterium]MBU1512991.1 molybdopterin-binding oxidoreductase [Alphaproteobacteria bacterium]MBU2095099.1 molybdopterin-binding oxidoreductase [Alphaproteobacteria bacterium]MBU2153032.1 molybdopterin-binding oxidoreductase [Alphaproteobacteria bacterium]MBU2306350.1 molybdopterin-binding oxidoreductase [Alphaproteobacteria bacterium]